MGRLVYVLPVVAAVALAAVFLWALDDGRDPSLVPSPLIGKPVPAFRVPALGEGEDLTEAAFTGGVTVFNVFASWCLPCRVEHPLLMRLAKEGEVRVFGLNYKDKPGDAKAWLAELGNPYARIGADRDGRAAIEWGVYGVPETFVVGADGRIRCKHVGPIMPADFKEKILPCIERSRP